jgi:hypothetical protein
MEWNEKMGGYCNHSKSTLLAILKYAINYCLLCCTVDHLCCRLDRSLIRRFLDSLCPVWKNPSRAEDVVREAREFINSKGKASQKAKVAPSGQDGEAGKRELANNLWVGKLQWVRLG